MQSKQYAGKKEEKEPYVQKLIQQSIMKQGKVDDMFRNHIHEIQIETQVDEDDFNEVVYQNQLKKFKMQRVMSSSSIQESNMILNKLNLMKSLKLMEGPLYIIGILEMIRLTR